MSFTKHGQNLYKITRLIAFNNYLIQEEDGLTLIDTNLPGSQNGTLKAAQEIGQAIRRIVITHAHGDHSADVDKLRAQLPDVELIMSARSARFLSGEHKLDAEEQIGELKGDYITIQSKPTYTVKDGDMIGSLRVIASPGHAPGHIALLDTRDNTLIAGDAYAVQAGIAVSGVYRLLFPFSAMATWHRPSALQSAIKLRDLKPARLAVGHGRILENPIAEMTKAIQEAQGKSDFVLKTVTVNS